MDGYGSSRVCEKRGTKCRGAEGGDGVPWGLALCVTYSLCQFCQLVKKWCVRVKSRVRVGVGGSGVGRGRAKSRDTDGGRGRDRPGPGHALKLTLPIVGVRFCTLVASCQYVYVSVCASIYVWVLVAYCRRRAAHSAWPSDCVRAEQRQFVLSSFCRCFLSSRSLRFALPILYLCVCVFYPTAGWCWCCCQLEPVAVCVRRSAFSSSIIVSLTSVPDVLCISCNTPLLLCISQMCDSWKSAQRKRH